VNHASDDPRQWLGATRLLDLEDPKLRIRVLRVTQLASSELQKAVFIHDYVKSLPFGCVAGFSHMPAPVVLRAGRGDCHTKGTLFVAMLRLVGISSRLRFVTLSSAFLDGIISVPHGTVTHAVAEAYLGGQWLQTDTYVADTALESSALNLLSRKGMVLGYGVHSRGNRFWSGFSPSHAQYSDKDPSSLPMHDWGVAHDPEHFYADKANRELRLGWLTRMKWMLAAAVVNRRVEQVRSQ
jgi:transglutaminase-like putative cysteine protease